VSALAALLLIPLAATAFAQSKIAQPKISATSLASVPPIEDRELYYSFFNYHQSLIASTQSAKTATPQNSSQLDSQMAALLQVDPKELQTVIANTQQVTQGYSQIANDRVAGIPAAATAATAAKSSIPLPNAAQWATICEFRRASQTVQGVLALYQKLTPASWNGLHGYITGTYKNTIYKAK
jgi:hypothetical protein